MKYFVFKSQPQHRVIFYCIAYLESFPSIIEVLQHYFFSKIMIEFTYRVTISFYFSFIFLSIFLVRNCYTSHFFTGNNPWGPGWNVLLKFSIKKKNFHCCYKKIFGWSKLVRSVFKKLVIEYKQGMRTAKRKKLRQFLFG